MASGQIIYVPKIIIDEVEDIITEEGITSRTEGLNKLVRYARVGREMDRMKRFDFSHKPLNTPFNNESIIPIPYNLDKKPFKRQKGGITEWQPPKM